MGDAAPSEAARRFLTFRMGRTLYALPAENVAEVIRTPVVARVPQAPRSLLGVANLRGEVLPVASLRGLLGQEEGAGSSSARTIVLQGPTPVALAVDAVQALVSVAAQDIETRQAELATGPGERLQGAFRSAVGDEVAKVLDIQALLDGVFVQRIRPERRGLSAGVRALAGTQQSDAARRKLVTFDVAGQEYGLPLEAVREIVPAPQSLTIMARSEAVVLGMTVYRDTLLPLLSFRGLLGLPAAIADGLEKVVVTRVGGVLVGLVADRMRAILTLDPELTEPTPAMLAARTGGESKIESIYRGEGGRRLISILDPDQLFREDVMQRLGEQAVAPEQRLADGDGEDLQVLVFSLSGEEFALPIEVVDEVAQAPAQVTRVPKTPDFIEGVVNLRGEVLPVVDQRRRFSMPALADGRPRRLIVVRTERLRAGLLVDSVTEVLRTPRDLVGEAPDLTGEATRLVQGVINLEGGSRIILLLNPAELLTRAERGVLETLQKGPADK
jgi:purine-binding chemotaxis protein CheW